MSLTLSRAEQRMLDGGEGPGVAMAMRIVVALARLRAADRLRPVASAHLDGCLHHGRAGLDFVERLVELGGQVRIPTTLNVGSLDLLHPTLARLSPTEASEGRKLMDTYVGLGARPTWTCAPYQEGHRPRLGEHVAWAESNAIVFCNSVLGARTDRYGDFLDVSAAITGLAPDAGLHLSENRRATLIVDCGSLSGELRSSSVLYPVLGYLAGRQAGTAVPVFTGLADARPDEDKLKALGATAASAGGVALFHVVGVTPEAPTLAAALGGRRPSDVPTVVVDADALRTARNSLTTARGDDIDAVSLGTPHFSLAEFAALAELTSAGAAFDPSTEVWVSTSRAVLAQARDAGYLDPIEQAGATILTDTCTYVTPVLRPGTRVVMTNSGKWAYYAPGNIGVDVVFADLAECVASARTGRVVRDDRIWS